MRPKLQINLGVIKSNYKYLCSKTKAIVAVSIKADAYGLGTAKIGPALFDAGCRNFFTANIDEATYLSQYVDPSKADIYAFHGIALENDSIDKFIKHNVYPVLNNKEQIEFWNNSSPSLKSAIHVDTGLNRYGIRGEDFQKIDRLPNHLEFFISHLSCDSDIISTYNKYQLEEFKKYTDKYEVKRSLSASGGIFLGEEYHFDMVRPGGIIFGTGQIDDKNLVNPVKLTAPIIHINHFDEEAYIGYDLKYHTKKGTKLATIPIGYADGFFRSFAKRGFVYFDGQKIPIAGSISMDLTIIDITNIDCKIGDEIEVIGPNNRPEILATYTNTNAYEILSHLSNGRYQREYTER